MRSKCMHVKELLQLIPEEELKTLAIETKVDHQVKKLNGLIMFQLILFSMLNRKRVSLRVMEEFLRSTSFRTLSNQREIDAKYNSLSDRFAMINPDYFEKIFHTIYDKFSNYLDEKKEIHRYDSTMIAVSSKLFNWGMKVGPKSKTDKKQLKFTIGMHGSLPSSLQLYSQQTELSEDIALSKAILADSKNRNNTVVFDRGLHSKKAFEKFNQDNILFVTRFQTNLRYEVQKVNKVLRKSKNDTVTITEDLVIKLVYDKKKEETGIFRLVKAVIDESQEEIYFLTNIQDMTCYEIAAIYKQRWEIETLFKFLKGEINISHLISRNENGVKVMMYMSLITAILVITYRKINNISSFKIAKLRLTIELETLVIKQIVSWLGGDMERFKTLFEDT